MKKKKLCKKCGDNMHCHYCGRQKDNRGWANSWKNTKDGPTHVICPSCAE